MHSTGWPRCPEVSAVCGVDSDPDSDFDPEERKSQQTDALDAHSPRQ
ncbi:MAG: hypothetical protein R6Y91_06230 [Desulfohalobium sp.]